MKRIIVNGVFVIGLVIVTLIKGAFVLSTHYSKTQLFMKKILCMLAFVLFVVPAFTQTIYIANSSPGAVGGTNVFTGSNSINSALAVAVTGDIIYVVPSSVAYGSPSLNGKGVSLIGGGFNPDKPGGALSTLSGIYANANNFRLSGLVIEGVNIPGSFSNIMIDKCRMKYLTDGSGGSAKGNLIIQNCIIGETSQSGSASLYIGVGSTNVRISNNIIYAFSPTANAITRLNAATIENNVFIGSASGGTLLAFSTVTNCDIKNNIFYGMRPTGTTNYTDNVQQYNLSFGASDNTFSTINGNTSVNNLEGQDPLFVNLPFGTSFSFTYDPALQVAPTPSPAIGSGLGGIDMGIFGGSTPYDIYGTSLPIVQTIIAPGTVSQGTNMDVRIKAKGN